MRPPSPSTGMGALASRPRHCIAAQQYFSSGECICDSSYFVSSLYPTSGIPSFTVRAQAGSKLRQKELAAELTKELTAIAENVCNERQGTALTSTLLRVSNNDLKDPNVAGHAGPRLLLQELSRCFRNRVEQAWNGIALPFSSASLSNPTAATILENLL